MIGDLLFFEAWRVYISGLLLFTALYWRLTPAPVCQSASISGFSGVTLHPVSGESLRELARGQPDFALLVLMISAMRCKMMCKDWEYNKKAQVT